MKETIINYLPRTELLRKLFPVLIQEVELQDERNVTNCYQLSLEAQREWEEYQRRFIDCTCK